MIILQIPECDKCTGCMFLKIRYVPDVAKCVLFDFDLRAQYSRYGKIYKDKVEKFDRCMDISPEKAKD